MTIKALYPNVRPSLDLNFARTKALDPRITFTRASTGTYVDVDGLIKTARSGAARFDHNPVTGESLGLLVEEARTNSLLYSQGFTTGWHTANAQVATGQTDPAGGTDAILVKQTNGTSTPQFITNSASTYIAANFTVSVFVKYVNYDYVILTGADQDNGASGNGIGYLLPKLRFQFSTETIQFQEATWPGGTTSTLSYGFQKYQNGWYRLWLTRNTSVRSNYWGIAVQSSYIGIDTFQLPAVTGDNSSSVLAFGFQVEQGAFPTSYIPTTSATVTRAADVADITGANFTNYFNRTEGTYFVEASRPTGNQVGTGIQLFTGFIGAFDNSSYFTWRYQGTNSLVWSTVDNGSYREMYVDTGAATNIKIVGAYKSGSNAVAWNGAIRATDNRTSASGDTGFYLNRDRFGSATLVSQIKRIAYYPTRLSDTQLVSLSQ